MNAALLPAWVQVLLLVLQALAVPVIAAAGVWIARQQMHIARVKLQHDLYDRRYAVFQAARTLLAEVTTHRLASDEALRLFVIGTSDARFLFDDKLADYLENMRQHVAGLHAISMSMDALPAGDQKAAASRAAGDHSLWLINQFDGLAEKFRPFLQLDARMRSAPRSAWWH